MECVDLRTRIALFALALACILAPGPAAHADRIMVGNVSGEVFGRDEFDLTTHIPASYANWGASFPISALAAGVQKDVAIGFDISAWYNTEVRKYDNMSVPITWVSTGSTISALTARQVGDIVIGDDSGAVFVRQRSNLTARPLSYTGGTDGIDFGGRITSLAGLSTGDLAIAESGGSLFVRRGTDLTQTAAGASVDNANFGIRINAVAVLPGDRIAVGLSSGWVHVRPLSNISTSLASVNAGTAVNALAPLSNGDVAIGLANGQVQVRRSTDMGLVTSATFTSGVAITALAATSTDNVAIGCANNLVFIRRGSNLTLRPPGYVGSDGLNFNAPVTALAAAPASGPAGWRDVSNRAALLNDRLEARLQSGILYQLIDRSNGRNLLSIDPSQLPGMLPVFGQGNSIDLDSCAVTVQSTSTTVTSQFTSPGGATWQLDWAIEAGAGDLVLQASATSPTPVGEFRYIFHGANIVDHNMVWVNGYGQGEEARAPWTGYLLADPLVGGSPQTFIHPIVALFEGGDTGWFLEGRESNIGPACLLIQGTGSAARIGAVRRFGVATTSPQMYEIRMRAYTGWWQDAVDPYLDWMQSTVGFVPLDQKTPGWIKNIKNQAYVTVGDYDGLDALAARVQPFRTFVGRQGEYRNYPFDVGYPNYQVSAVARPWISRARQLGFHVGAHFNTYCIDKTLYPNLVAQFEPGLMQIGTDGQGNPIYDGFGNNVYCSPAYKPWRDYLIAQMADAVSAGIDVIYLDQSMSPCGKFVVDGVTGVQGVMLLEQEILQAYPTVAIETEQFNPMASRHAAFALSQMTLGHPLSGYIFSRFVKVVPEGIMYSPTDGALMDDFDRWGFMLPGADAKREETWMQIAEAYQDYNLVPDSRLSLQAYQSFGLRGANGVTAYFEKQNNVRGLTIYEPGKPPAVVGARHYGISSWPGPGLPVYWEYGQLIRDWLVYDGATLLGLNPQHTYYIDPGLSTTPNRFHIYSVPADFALCPNPAMRTVAQGVGERDSYFKVYFSGNGQLGVFVPDGYDAHLDSQPISVDPVTRTAVVAVASTPANPSCVRAVRRSEMQLVGRWVHFPLQTPAQVPGWVSREGTENLVNMVGGIALAVGKLPQTANIRLTGAYGMNDASSPEAAPGDGVVRINGAEVLRINPGARPYQLIPFDVDISAFAGRYVLIEILCDVPAHSFAYANWVSPRITAGPTPGGTAPIGASATNSWNSAGAVVVRASSQHPSNPAQSLINGSGVLSGGELHSNGGLFVTGQLAASLANPRGGTVEGGHWVEFELDRVYPLGEMWLWNYNGRSPSSDYRVQGFRRVTIQYSATGGISPAEWSTAYASEVPMAASSSPDYVCLPSMKLDFGGAAAKYVVITTDSGPSLNWSGGLYGDAGLSEVRFYSSAASSVDSARRTGDGAPVSLHGAVVTAAFRGARGPVGFAVEEADRSAGIRIVSNAQVAPGDSVNVSGEIATVAGERVIHASSVAVVSDANPTPRPLAMSGADSGGGAYHGQPAVADDAVTGRMSTGANSVGLLVTVFGRVTSRNDTGDWSGWFYLDDGSGLRDGSGSAGIRCRPFGSGSAPDTLPPVGSYVSVTGVMGVQRFNNVNTRYLWTTSVTPAQ